MESYGLNLLSIGLNKIVNTGDRLLDTTLVGVITLLFTGCLHHLYNNGHRYVNRLLYQLFKKHETPFGLFAPFLIKYYISGTPDQFLEKSHCIAGHWYITKQFSSDIYSSAAMELGIFQCPLIFSGSASNRKGIIYISTSGSPIQIELFGSTVRLVKITPDGYPIYMDRYLRFYMELDHPEMIDYVMYLAKEFEKKCIELAKNKESNDLMIQIPRFEGGKFSGWKKTGDVCKRKTFENLFYDQKETVVEMVKKFQTKTMYPAHVPMDNKLGILLYGPPGTGKTGTISAIANMLNRHICVIDFSKIQTREQLDLIITPADYKTHIYVFDEIDCILDVLTGTRPANVETKKDWGSLLLAAEGEERKEILQMMRGQVTNASSSIDMAYLLQKLDGLESAEDRIIVATTNHPEKLHPALLRPGRFDLKLCLGNCSSRMYLDILGSFFKGDSNARNKIAAAKLPEFKLSPLMVINAALQERNLDRLLHILKRMP